MDLRPLRRLSGPSFLSLFAVYIRPYITAHGVLADQRTELAELGHDLLEVALGGVVEAPLDACRRVMTLASMPDTGRAPPRELSMMRHLNISHTSSTRTDFTRL